MSIIQNVLIIGASGNLGPSVLDALLAVKQFKVSVVSRPESVAVFPTAVRVIRSDYSIESLEKAFHGQDAVVSTVGNEGFAHQQEVVEAAIRAGVKRFIPSEFGINTADFEVIDFLPIVFGSKRRFIEFLQKKESEGLSWTAISTGAFLDWGITSGFLKFDVKAKTVHIWGDGKTSFTATSLAQVGRAVASVLRNPVETANRQLYVSSTNTSQEEILSALTAITNSRWTVVKVDTDSEIARLRTKLTQNDYSVVGDLIGAAIFGRPLGDLRKAGLNNELLDLNEEKIEDVIKGVIEAME